MAHGSSPQTACDQESRCVRLTSHVPDLFQLLRPAPAATSGEHRQHISSREGFRSTTQDRPRPMVIRELSAGPFSLGLLVNKCQSRDSGPRQGALGVELRVMPCQMLMKASRRRGPLTHRRSRGKMAKGSPKVAKVIANKKKEKKDENAQKLQSIELERKLSPPVAGLYPVPSESSH